MKTALKLAVVLLGLAAVAVATDQVLPTVAGFSPDKALELGKRMYREGILPSGEPMTALVSGDIEVDGTMFSCSSCHLRSGLGSLEGTVITLPINGDWLARPLVGRRMSPKSRERLPEWFTAGEIRPPYTDEALADAIILGRDPKGRELHPAMPLYELDEPDMEVLVHYLRNLSAGWSPGVTDTTMRFATVVTEGVEARDRDAMLSILEAHVRDHNTQDRHEEERRRRGPWEMEEMWKPYRKWSLARWELTGPPETWRAQLEDHYAREPVFALLGGLAAGDWTPIHRFAEDHEIPSLFPVTDYPVLSETDWYSLYFSKGLYQEGEAAARFLRRSDRVEPSVRAVQVYRSSPEGRALARGFRETCRDLGMPEPEDHVLAVDGDDAAKELRRLVQEHRDSAFAVWLPGGGLAPLRELPRPPLVLTSATLLGDPLRVIPEELRDVVYVTYPSALPDDQQQTRLGIERWLKIRNIPVTNYALQAKMYFLGKTLGEVVMMMRDHFYRDYLLDLADMMRDQDYTIGVYPRLSFGQGQRYASKGCYVVQVSPGPEPSFVRRSEWVIQ